MSDAPRQILMPGETAQAAPAVVAPAAEPAPERKKPGPKPRAAAAAPAAGDDLDQFDEEALPPRPAAPAAASLASFSPDQLQAINQVINERVAEGIRAAMSSRDPRTAVDIAAKAAQPQRLPTQDEARVMCEDMVAKNIRPRAILTSDGWYAHPEMARVVDHGVARLQVN